jgi:hypothetical protein
MDNNIWLSIVIELFYYLHFHEVIILTSRHEHVLAAALVELFDNEGTEEAGTASH